VAFHKRYPLFASGSDDGTVIVCHGMVYKYVAVGKPRGVRFGSASGVTLGSPGEGGGREPKPRADLSVSTTATCSRTRCWCP